MSFFGPIKGMPDQHISAAEVIPDTHPVVPAGTHPATGLPVRNLTNGTVPALDDGGYDPDDNPDVNSRPVEFDSNNQSFWRMLDGLQQRSPSSLPQLPAQPGQPQIPGTARSPFYPSLKVPPEMGFFARMSASARRSISAALFPCSARPAVKRPAIAAFMCLTLSTAPPCRAIPPYARPSRAADTTPPPITTALIISSTPCWATQDLKRDWGEGSGGFPCAQMSSVCELSGEGRRYTPCGSGGWRGVTCRCALAIAPTARPSGVPTLPRKKATGPD